MLRHYLLLSVKVLRRRPFFTFISIFGISFTLLVLTVVTAILDQTFGPGKPETRKPLMLAVRNAYMSGPAGRHNGSPGFRLYEQYAQDLPGVAELSIFSPPGESAVYYLNGERITRQFRYTDASYWRILDFDFIEGGPYRDDDVAQARRVAVINRSTRTRFFGERPAVGQYIGEDDRRLRIVGVVEDVSLFRIEPFSDVWAPYTIQPSDSYRRQLTGGFWMLALARDEAALAGIRQEFNARLERVEFDDPRSFNLIVAPFETEVEFFVRAFTGTDDENPDGKAWIFYAVIGTAALLFMALPTVNLINVNISRILERASEIGVRKAFGAPARALVVQFVVENVLLTFAGGAIGLTLSAFVLRAINESGAIPYAQLGLNLRVFAYGLGLALVFGLLSGVYPAWRMARLHPVSALRGGAAR